MRNDFLEWVEQLIMIDRTEELTESDPLYSFALDELLCKKAYITNAAYCHLWRHPKAFILGQRDRHLPYAADAIKWLRSLEYNVVIRNSGGAAVPLDLDVVNVSLIFPIHTNEHDFHQDFDKMYGLISHALQFTNKKVEKGEILGAFCPGDYDLSISGKKFCGIAQRRKLQAYVVQAFIITGGSGAKRTSIVREFYNQAAVGADPSQFPQVTDESTASLEELTSIGANATKIFIDSIKKVVETYSKYNSDHNNLHLPSPEIVRDEAQKLRERY